MLFLCFVLETGSHNVDQAGPELTTFCLTSAAIRGIRMLPYLTLVCFFRAQKVNTKVGFVMFCRSRVVRLCRTSVPMSTALSAVRFALRSGLDP